MIKLIVNFAALFILQSVPNVELSSVHSLCMRFWHKESNWINECVRVHVSKIRNVWCAVAAWWVSWSIAADRAIPQQCWRLWCWHQLYNYSIFEPYQIASFRSVITRIMALILPGYVVCPSVCLSLCHQWYHH